VEFRAPDRAGEETYACTPHSELMRGTIRVE
jgi:plastocyanin